ncbi:LamG-like jellyroll fold domain-containing protein [Tamlana flava]|uniref:LamG-like jellyroll fold domain-containing protein n=1 Tax=Tamlana flava TaxID=3158572 RepID=UPI00351B6A57
MLRKITIKIIVSCSFLSFFGINLNLIQAQASTSDNLKAQPVADRVVPFDITDQGISKTIQFGADLAWDSEQNFRRVVLFGGLDQLDIVRVSHQPSYPLVNGTDLTQQQIDKLNGRLYILNTFGGSNMTLAMNCDHSKGPDPYVDPWYVGQPQRWLNLIKASAQAYQNAGHNIVTIGAFNEPDFGWGQGSIDDMYAINQLMVKDDFFTGIRISGGNTLNCDQAQYWYDYLRPSGVNEGNTHQLAGNFDNFASFLTNVRANGHHATLDEMHNVAEALVGYEYGMQTGIWWGPAERARGEMVKAFDGERLGYAEHRFNWTAAAVYRTPSGKVQGFIGGSERQAINTTYNYVSKDRAVYYDGVGPQREFVLELPGADPADWPTIYQNGQTNGEKVFNITWGDDIQPVIDGQYVVINKKSGLVLTVAGDSNEANVFQGTYSGAATQHWNITPVDSRVGLDFSYHFIQPANSTTKRLDLAGFNLNNGANIFIYGFGGSSNQRWYFDYDGDGYFRIRSGESSKAIVVAGGVSTPGANVIQWSPPDTDEYLWRLLPVGVPLEFDAPTAPTNLVATRQDVSIKLDWTASTSNDVSGYTVLRSESASGPYNTIARNITLTSFIDNTTKTGVEYFYVVRAEDNSLNRSENSNVDSETATGDNALVSQYDFEGDILDSSINLNHGAISGATFTGGHIGSGAINLDGSNDFVQLPADIANHQEITVAAWVNWNGGGFQQRIFDFGIGEEEYMSLSPNGAGFGMRFAITKGGFSTEQALTVPKLTSGVWKHVALTLGASGAKIYVDGDLVGENTGITLRPEDIVAVKNYIGRSQYNQHAYFSGKIDDFRVYNYAMSPEQISDLHSVTLSVEDVGVLESLTLWPVPAKDELHLDLSSAVVNGRLSLSIYDLHGRTLSTNQISESKTILDISELPRGMYLLKLDNGTNSTVKRFVVN